MEIEEINKILVGFAEKEAIRELEHAGYETRIVQVDDELFVVTCDYVPTRANLSVRDGKITSIYLG